MGTHLKLYPPLRQLTGEGEDLPVRHCMGCLPFATLTKLGPCLVVQCDGVPCSIDLIPVLPHPGRCSRSTPLTRDYMRKEGSDLDYEH